MYKHKVQYYETDQMGVVHHSNYIRWFEEARMNYLEVIGVPYEHLEELGFGCPVLGVQADYLRMVKFGDTVTLHLMVKEYNSIKMTIAYEIISDRTDMVHCKGETKHCFLTNEGKPVSLKKSYPDVDKRFREVFFKEED